MVDSGWNDTEKIMIIRYSSQKDSIKFGAGNGIRTRDPQLGRLTL